MNNAILVTTGILSVALSVAAAPVAAEMTIDNTYIDSTKKIDMPVKTDCRPAQGNKEKSERVKEVCINYYADGSKIRVTKYQYQRLGQE